MKFIIIGGYGEIGSYATRDLVKSCKGGKIIVAGRDEKKAIKYAQSFKRKNVIGRKVDIKNKDELAELLKGSDVVVNCSNYYNNLNVMNACLQAKCNYLDLGGLFHITKKQLKLHNQFKRRKLIAVLGCGSTPGITNVLAEYGSHFFDKIHEIHVTFADHDYSHYKHHFVLPYSIFTLEDEFTKKPAVFTKGKLKFVKALSGKRTINFPKPVGDLNGYYTLHSELATFPSSFKNKGIKECSFRVTFTDDFIHDVNVIIESGMLSKKPITLGKNKVVPADVALKELNRLIPSHKDKVNDLEYIRVEIIGIKNKKDLTMTLDCLTKSDKIVNAPAGIVDTGIPPSIIAQMISKKQVKKYGVLPPEKCVHPKKFFTELKKRGIKIIMQSNYKREI